MLEPRPYLLEIDRLATEYYVTERAQLCVARIVGPLDQRVEQARRAVQDRDLLVFDQRSDLARIEVALAAQHDSRPARQRGEQILLCQIERHRRRDQHACITVD